MSPETILYILIAAVISLIIAVFMYGYKTKYTGKLRWLFGGLRFLTLFGILVLLINPKFENKTFSLVKPKLSMLVDNSFSVKSLEKNVIAKHVVTQFQESSVLNEKFDITYFKFGDDFKGLDSLSFDDKNTNISQAFRSVSDIFEENDLPLVLVSDGNQTFGTDYEFAASKIKSPIFPVILGDSIKHTDLKIEQLTSNRYAFLKNKFPVETVLVYSGTGSVDSQFIVNQGTTVVHREAVSFSESDNVKTISITLPATSVGLQSYTARVVALDDEKNKTNNNKRFAVEVIDQATNVLLVSSVLHPDLGMLKKAITTNEQRTVTIKKPQDAAQILNDYQLVILYQPDRKFASVYQELKNLGKNTFVITGTQTDWAFVNAVQEYYEKEVTSQTENATASLNLNYGTFAIDPIGFENFPPLKTQFGALSIRIPHQVVLEQTIDNIASNTPMLATMELNNTRHAIWDGEDLWKWRAQTYRSKNSFETFDAFIGKMIQYLASNKRKSRLEVSSETFYYNNNPIKISAQYFDKSFVFDNRAALSISVVNKETKKRDVFPLLLKNNYFEVNLNSLNAGAYSYTVSVRDQEVARSGSFTILQFNIEQQFLNANVAKLKRVAEKTNGKAFYSNQIDQLINQLVENDSYKAVQISEQKVVPLIDWKWLLGLIALLLAIEWFIRKFNGLI